MYYGELKNCDITNGEGVRVTLFVSGCTNHCKNCFQPQTWDFEYGQPFTEETEQHLLELLSPSYINGLTLLGGEPFEPENQRVLVPFLRRGRLPEEKHLVLLRLYLRGADHRRHPPPLRGNGRDAVSAGCAGGRPLRGGAEGHLPAVPWQPEPAPHRPERQPGGGTPLFPAGPSLNT